MNDTYAIVKSDAPSNGRTTATTARRLLPVCANASKEELKD